MLRHITIISSDGLTIYHKSFVKDQMDEVLFSALTGAIIAFSKELGDTLNSIIMQRQMIYFVNSHSHIVIFSLKANENISQREVKRKLNLAIKSTEIQQICKIGVALHVNRQLESDLEMIFNVDTEGISEENEVPTVEELTGDAFIEALSKLDSI